MSNTFSSESHILTCKPFNPQTFSDLTKGLEVDERIRQRAVGNLDASKIVVKTYLKEGETSISNEERYSRIKVSTIDVPLDADDLLALWEEEGHTTLEWLYEVKGLRWLSFWGTILRRPRDGRRCVLTLQRDITGTWRQWFNWIISDCRRSGHPAAVLEL